MIIDDQFELAVFSNSIRPEKLGIDINKQAVIIRRVTKMRIQKEEEENLIAQNIHSHHQQQQLVQIKKSFTHVIVSHQHHHHQQQQQLLQQPNNNNQLKHHYHHHHQHVATSAHGSHVYSNASNRPHSHHIHSSNNNNKHISNNNRYQFRLDEQQRSQIRFILMAAFAYILSPIDLVPEIMFGVFGIIDDIVFLFMCLFCVSIVLLYPLFREVRRTLFDKLGLRRRRPIFANKTF